MIKQARPLKRIMLFLALVVILTVFLQLSRSLFFLQWGQYGEESYRYTGATARDALTPAQLAGIQTERILIVFDPDDPFSLRMKRNFEQTLAEMKKTCESVAAPEFALSDEPDVVIVAMTDLALLDSVDTLAGYVERGGRVLLAASPEVNNAFYLLYRKLGILEIGDLVVTEGVRFFDNILLGVQKNEEMMYEGLENTVLRVKLAESSAVGMETGEGMPLMWKTAYGEGAFLVFNGTMLQEKANRGLIAGALAELLPDFMYPILNTKTMYIDDFPAPFPQGSHPEISGNYGLETSKFFKNVWWPDMIRLSRKHGLKYTGALIVSYTDNVAPPFDWQREGDTGSLLIYGRELLKDGGEIALHGYNHQSLTFTPRIAAAYGYNTWKTAEDMRQSLIAARQFIESVFDGYKIRTYVPPSNVLDPNVRRTMMDALPDLQYVASLWNEDATQLSYVQDYRIGDDGLLDVPRVTSGYGVDNYDRWLMANAITVLGVFSHFVHPDDVLDPIRNKGRNWGEMYGAFDEFLRTTDERYGWLRSTTASESGEIMRRWALSEPVVDRLPGQLNGYINHFTGDLYFLLRSDKRVAHTEGCQIWRIDDGAYLVKAERETFSIEWAD